MRLRLFQPGPGPTGEGSWWLQRPRPDQCDGHPLSPLPLPTRHNKGTESHCVVGVGETE